MIIKKLIYFFVLFTATDVLACDCDQLDKLSLENCGVYDVIFEGKVESVSACDNGESKIVFSINDIFKGDFISVAEVKNVCTDDCAMHFEKGETWLVYAEKNNAQEVIVHFCSRSRKRNEAGESDDYVAASGYSYEQEKEKLKEFFPNKEEAQSFIKPRRYEKVEPSTTILLLVVSLAFLLVGFWAFKKFVK